MTKVRKTTLIHLPHGNHARCPIYQHGKKFYVKANKPNVGQYEGFYLDGIEYAEVECLGMNTESEFWYQV